MKSVIAAWYNADYVTLVDGLVSGARDLTGNGNDGTQTTSSKRLMFFPSDAMFGGRASFGSTSIGSGDYLTTPSMTAVDIITSIQNSFGTRTTFAGYDGLIRSWSPDGTKYIIGNSGKSYFYSSGSFSSTVSKNGAAPVSIGTAILPLGACILRFKGTAATNIWNIGNDVFSSNRAWYGSYRSIAISSSDLSNYQIQLIEGVMAWDGGTQERLVAGHPFANRPPEIGD